MAGGHNALHNHNVIPAEAGIHAEGYPRIGCG